MWRNPRRFQLILSGHYFRWEVRSIFRIFTTVRTIQPSSSITTSSGPGAPLTTTRLSPLLLSGRDTSHKLLSRQVRVQVPHRRSISPGPDPYVPPHRSPPTPLPPLIQSLH